MNLLTRLKNSPARRAVAWLWHHLIPPITVTRRIWDLRVHFDLRDNIDDLTRPRAFLEGREPDMMHVQRQVSGLVWDVGCNIGFFAFPAARNGNAVVAFDMSEKAVGLLQRTANANGLNIVTVPRALTVEPMRYVLPRTSYKENRLQSGQGQERHSITFSEAASQHGVPRLLKMDIEGGEREFFASAQFKDWVCQNGITWLVELHPQFGGVLEWPDVPHRRLAGGLVALYHRDEAWLARIAPPTETTA